GRTTPTTPRFSVAEPGAKVFLRRHYHRRWWARAGHGSLSGISPRHHQCCLIDKGWLGGGNMGRNTTIIRSNYLWDESADIYETSMKLWEELPDELEYDFLFSQRGVLNLAHHVSEARDSVRRVKANVLNGVDS